MRRLFALALILATSTAHAGFLQDPEGVTQQAEVDHGFMPASNAPDRAKVVGPVLPDERAHPGIGVPEALMDLLIRLSLVWAG